MVLKQILFTGFTTIYISSLLRSIKRKLIVGSYKYFPLERRRTKFFQRIRRINDRILSKDHNSCFPISFVPRVYIRRGQFFFFLSTDPFSRPKFHQARRDDRVCSRVTDLRFPTISDKVRARADKKGERGTWQRISRRRMGQSRNFTSNRGLHPPPRPFSRAAAPATILRTRNVLWFLPSLLVSAPAAHPKNTPPFQGIFR